MHRVLMNFQNFNGWTCHFIEDDCKTLIGQRMKNYHFPTLDALRSFVQRCNADSTTLAKFDECITQWGKGSVFLNLTHEQYFKIGGKLRSQAERPHRD